MATKNLEYNNGFGFYLDEDEVDDLRASMAFILMESTELEDDYIYSLVFSGGQNITWH